MIGSHPHWFVEFLELQAENVTNLIAALRRRRQRKLRQRLRREAREKRVPQPAIPVPVATPEPAPIALVAVDPRAGDTVVDWIREYRARYGRDPMIKEVQRKFVISKSTAHRRIKAS